MYMMLGRIANAPRPRSPGMKRSIRFQKWVVFLALSAGTTFQLSTCREESALFGLRWAVTSVTLPINTFIRQIFLNLPTI
jgi:hypothetical protein